MIGSGGEVSRRNAQMWLNSDFRKLYARLATITISIVLAPSQIQGPAPHAHRSVQPFLKFDRQHSCLELTAKLLLSIYYHVAPMTLSLIDFEQLCNCVAIRRH